MTSFESELQALRLQIEALEVFAVPGPVHIRVRCLSCGQMSSPPLVIGAEFK